MPVAVGRRGCGDTCRGTPAKFTARVAAARILLTLAYYALRDGHVRRLDRATA